MANVHAASLFDYTKYQQTIQPLVTQVDNDDFEAVRSLTYQAIEQFQRAWPLSDEGMFKYTDGVAIKVLTQLWPLHSHNGELLTTTDKVEAIANPSQQDLGYWFLIILGRFVQSCPTPGSNWSVLNTVLDRLRWSQEQRALLFLGMPTASLLKPNANQALNRPLTPDDPYWYWLRLGASRSGWLTHEQAQELHTSLLEIQDKVLRFDISHFPNIHANNPIVIEDYEDRLRQSYEATVQMLSAAIESGLGLFMSISRYS